MRKMKKFLAVALSAAMVLSVSVPAMAAGETNDTQVVQQDPALVADYEAKLAAEAEAQGNYDDLEAELKAALAIKKAIGDRATASKADVEAAIAEAQSELNVPADSTEAVTKKAADDARRRNKR